MGLLDLHAPEFEAAAGNARISPAPQTPAYSTWDLTTAIPRGVGAGVAEMGASVVDIASGLALGMKRLRDATPEQMRAYDKAGTLNVAEDFQSDFGRAMRDEAKRWMPDQMTTHSSAQVVAEFARMLGKVAATAPFVGPVASAGIVGLEEGFTASDKLAQEGVDFNTRTNVGALTAGVTAATFALPVAGKTVGQTVGLALGGGPVAYIGQQAATRAILKDADYSHLSDRYDPFDPLGLALSTILPLGFGAMGMRAASTAKAKQAAATAAKAERDFMAGPLPSEKSAISRAIDMQTEDAARVALLQEVSAAHRLTPADDLAAAAAHDKAMATALGQVNSGQRVDVADGVVPHVQREANFRAWFGDSKVADKSGAPLVAYHVTDSDILSFDRSFLGTTTEWNTDAKEASRMARLGFWFAARDISEKNAASGVVYPVYLALSNPRKYRTFDSMWADAARYASADAWRAALEKRGYDGVILEKDSEFATRSFVAFRPEQIKSAIGNSGRFDQNSASLTDPLPALTPEQFGGKPFAEFVGNVDKAVKEMAAVDAGPSMRELAKANKGATALAEALDKAGGTGYASEVKRLRDAAKLMTPDAARHNNLMADMLAARDDAAKPSPLPPKAEGETAREGSAGLARAAADLEAINPDLLIRIDGMDEAIPLKEFMARVNAEAAKDLEQAPLIEAAAMCALRAGM